MAGRRERWQQLAGAKMAEQGGVQWMAHVLTTRFKVHGDDAC